MVISGLSLIRTGNSCPLRTGSLCRRMRNVSKRLCGCCSTLPEEWAEFGTVYDRRIARYIHCVERTYPHNSQDGVVYMLHVMVQLTNKYAFIVRCKFNSHPSYSY